MCGAGGTGRGPGSSWLVSLGMEPPPHSWGKVARAQNSQHATHSMSGVWADKGAHPSLLHSAGTSAAGEQDEKH